MPFLRSTEKLNQLYSRKKLLEPPGKRPRAILMSFLRSTEKLNHFFGKKLPEPQESVLEQF